MDQYPFRFEFYVSGIDVDDFIKMLEKVGYTEQAKCCRLQFESQLNNI